MTTTTATPEQINAQARSQAQAALEGIAIKPTSLLEYRSRGRVAVIGGPEAMEFAPRLQVRHQTSVVLLHGAEEPGVTVLPVGGRGIEITGHLGDFNITLGMAGKPNHEVLNVDLVLDLSPIPLLSMPLSPPGYLYSDSEEHSLVNAEQQLADLVGTFDKPRYFAYDASICAHARAGQTACNRCITACPAEAITSLVEAIKVDPYLCQGGGVCASVCPTGAIRYNYPAASDMLDRIRRLLQAYRQHEGAHAVIVFVAEADVATLNAIPSNLLPVIVEEVASIGLDVWLAALAYGARRVLLLESPSMAARVSNALQMQLLTAQEILLGLGYADDAIALVRSDDINTACDALMPELPAATFAGLSEKRRMMFMALDHLHAHSPAAPDFVPLSPGAPFGAIEIDNTTCTLCLACTSVCPTHAVFAGNETPKLMFNEAQCVQCGICSSACPERAIILHSRLLADPQLRQRQITLHEEPPLCCVSCGKPFATKSVLTAMLAKLEGHWMFQDERAKRRLMMCEDCRVVDIVQDPQAMEQGFEHPRRQ